MTEFRLLRVFTGDRGRHGNPLAVFLEGAGVPHARRQEVAAQLGYSETVFVDDPGRGEIAIFTPAAELPFAGHPTVGTAWLLAREGFPVETLRPPAGELPARAEDETAFVTARPEWAPAFELRELASAAEVEALDGPPDGLDLVSAWAWADRGAGLIRARVFPQRLGIAEDEATGAAAVRLCAQLARPIEIRQGRGSRILARPAGDSRIEIGGSVALEGMRLLGRRET